MGREWGQGHSETRSSTSQLPGLLKTSPELRGHVIPIPGGQDRIPLPPSPASSGRRTPPHLLPVYSMTLLQMPGRSSKKPNRQGWGVAPLRASAGSRGPPPHTHTANLLPAPRRSELLRLALELKMLGGSWVFLRLRPWASAPHGRLVCP